MLSCLILGGGVGSRLGSLTRKIPKPLVPVAGVPFVFRQLEWLVSEGVTDVVYSIGHLGHLIRNQLEARSDLGCTIRFVDEGDSLRGTGGAVRFAVDEAPLSGSFFVLYGDSYLEVDLASVQLAFAGAGVEALMTVYRNDGAWDRSNVVMEGDRVTRYDKTEVDPDAAGMHYIDYGLSILRASTVQRLVPVGTPNDLGDVFHGLSRTGQLAAYEAQHRFYEIGSPAGLDALERHLTARST